MRTLTSTRKPPAHQSPAAENAIQTAPVRPSAWLAATCSPRANVACSFLLAIEWLRSKWRHIVDLFPQQTPVRLHGFTSANRMGKYRRNRHVTLLLFSALFTGAGGLAVAHIQNEFVPQYQIFSDPQGHFASLNLAGPTDTAKNAFFQDLGTNGRRCVTCHQASDAWSVTNHTFESASMPLTAQTRFSGPMTAPVARRKMSQRKVLGAQRIACC